MQSTSAKVIKTSNAKQKAGRPAKPKMKHPFLN